ncbi:MAG: SDR family oxidoreductase [Chloroflexi bacterium]|nr:SDR family oxidoreductase [Chloroflexota bacterium]
MSELGLDGRVALVTGASRGIGRAVALELARRGATVVATSRTIETAEALAEELAQVNDLGWTPICDVRHYAEVEAAVAGTLERFGRLDVLVNNAGVIEPIALLDTVDPDVWAECISVNLVGALHGCRAALPPMLARGHGVIINISSGAASSPREGWSAYCASKAGLAMLTQSITLEFGGRGILAYGLRPGVVDTDMHVTIRASGINAISRLRREDLADPRDPARAVAYLCHPAATDLAGQEIEVRDPAFRGRAGLDDQGEREP